MALAEARLTTELNRLWHEGAEADGEIGDADPLRAIRNLLHEQEFDEIILSTLPPGASRWLRMDLPHRVERSSKLPVTHIVGPHGPTSMRISGPSLVRGTRRTQGPPRIITDTDPAAHGPSCQLDRRA
jgi:hypothetical protein